MSLVLYETDGQIGIITLNRPEMHNCMNVAMIKELDQVLDNIRSYRELTPITQAEMDWLSQDVNRIYRAQGPVKDLSKYQGLTLYGVPVTAIMEAYSVCQLQPDPGFSDDNNYLLNAIAEESHLDFSKELPRQSLIAGDGTDVTDEVYTAYEWLRANTF